MNILTRERQQGAESAALNASARNLSAELLAALRLGDLAAPALFAPMTPDWSSPIWGPLRPMRHQALGDLMLGQVSGTDDFDQMLGLVCSLAYTAESHANLAAKARTLLKKIAQDFADGNATSGDAA